MSLSPRELIQQQIRRKTAKTKELRKKQAERSKPEDRVFRFLSDFDSEYRSCDNDIDRAFLIESESHALLRDINLIDYRAQIELIWYGNTEGNLQDLRLEGVKIIWSDEYRVANKLDSCEQLFDLSDLLFR